MSDIGTMSAVAKDCTGKFLICVKYVTLPFDLRTTSGNENSRPDGVRILPVPNASRANSLCHLAMPEYFLVNCS